MKTAVFTKWFVVVLLLCLCRALMAAETAQIIYVDDDAAGANDGSSWADALNDLQDALAQAAVATEPVEIRVAQGVYKPDQGTGVTPGDRLATFQLRDGVSLKGGYAGAAAPDPDVRDVELYETVLSGDLAGDDDADPTREENSSHVVTGSVRAENSCHVVTGSGTDGTAVIDGFTITAGSAFPVGGGQPSVDGAGMLVDAGSPTVLNCRFVDNFARSGAAFLACNGSDPIVTNCEFLNNDGTAMRNMEDSDSVLTNCRFEGNTSEGMENRRSSPVITGCRFICNEGRAIDAWDCNSVLTDCAFKGCEGGIPREGIHCVNGTLSLTGCTFEGLRREAIWVMGDLTLVRCTFRDNTGSLGGAVHCSFGGRLIALECTFVGNSGFLAGAIEGGDMELHDCEFTGNSGLVCGAVDAGGDVLIATGCIFSGNRAEHGAGAISSAAIAKLSNCTFVGDYGRCNTLEYWQREPLAAQLTQCIVRDGPEPFGPRFSISDHINVAYSDVEGGFPGEGNIDVDPCFVDPGYWADPNDLAGEIGPEDPNAVWMAGDYHLRSQAGRWDRAAESWVRDGVTSPCIDTGNPVNPLGVEPFPNGGCINMGAYGGTGEASKSYFGEPVCEIQIPGDINGDCRVDQTDMDILQAHWLMEAAGLVNIPPTITLISPEDGAELTYPTPIVLQSVASDPDGTVLRVGYTLEYRKANLRSTTGMATTDPADNWCRVLSWPYVRYDGTYTVWAEAMDNEGTRTISPKITVTLHPSP